MARAAWPACNCAEVCVALTLGCVGAALRHFGCRLFAAISGVRGGRSSADAFHAINPFNAWPLPVLQVIGAEPPNTVEQWSCNAGCVDGTLLLNLACVQVISVEPPNTVELEVVETDPGVKGNTAVRDLQMRVPRVGWRWASCKAGWRPAPASRATHRGA